MDISEGMMEGTDAYMDRLVITSRQNPLIKTVCGLSEKKKRAESGLFRIDGIKLVREAADTGMEMRYVICTEYMSGVAEELATGASADTLVTVSEPVFEKLSEQSAPEGIMAVCVMPESLHSSHSAEECAELLRDGERILIAESLRDPGNLGTVMRSCFALGIDRLVLTSDCADIYNPKTQRAAMGAIFRLPTLTVTDSLPELIERLKEKGRRVFATALHTEAVVIGDIKLCAGDCFVIGNEGHGLTEQTIQACTSAAIIPMTEGAESLNAAAAATICIWETVRAQGEKL